MDKDTDQTNFWLAWHATCSAAACVDGETLKKACGGDQTKYGEVLDNLSETQKLAREMINSTNNKFKRALDYHNGVCKGRVNSDFADEVSNWRKDDPSFGCAFSLLESWLYAKESIKGRPFKDYLFEEVASRSGGMCNNLMGYINQTLRTLARNSFSKVCRREEQVDDEGNVLEDDISREDLRDDCYSLPSYLIVDINRVVDFFGEYVNELGSPQNGEPAVWDKDNWISLYCALHQIPINTPKIAALCRRAHSALSVVYKQTVGNLLLVLRKRLKASDRAIARAMDAGVVQVLDERMKNMPFYAELEAIRLGLVKKVDDKAEKSR